MKEETKLVKVDITGEETIRHIRTVVMEVPVDMPEEEVESINADIFDYVEPNSEWEVEESYGISPTGSIDFVGPADKGAEPEVIVYRLDKGEYEVKVNEKSSLA